VIYLSIGGQGGGYVTDGGFRALRGNIGRFFSLRCQKHSRRQRQDQKEPTLAMMLHDERLYTVDFDLAMEKNVEKIFYAHFNEKFYTIG
jgi:hypothetical protein